MIILILLYLWTSYIFMWAAHDSLFIDGQSWFAQISFWLAPFTCPITMVFLSACIVFMGILALIGYYE